MLTRAHSRIFCHQLWKKLASRRVPCPLCDSWGASLTYETPNVHMAIFRNIFTEKVTTCDHCGFVYTNPRLSAKQLERFYTDNYGLEGLPLPETIEEFLGHSHKDIWFSKDRDLTLVLEAKRSGRLLDIGCNSGTLLWLARERGFAGAGVEVGRRAAAFANTVLGLDVFCGQLEEAGFCDRSFDVVTMIHSLEHVPSPRRVLEEVHRVLAGDGVFIAIVPNLAGWSSEKDGARWRWLQPENHYSHFTPQSLLRLAESARFDATLRSEEGRYGESEFHARGLDPSTHSKLRGSEIVLIARKKNEPVAAKQETARDVVPQASAGILAAQPTVSVLIDTYNHERFIEQALTSVIEQSFPAEAAEILVVDDGSTDRTAEIVRKFAPRVRLLQKSNGGQASAFNAGIPETRGEIVAFLDGDDWWSREKLSQVVDTMSLDSSIGLVGHGIIMIDRDGREQPEILREGFRFQANKLEGAKLLRRRGSFLGTSRMTIRASLLRRIGPIPEAIAVQADEYLFTLAAVLSGVRILPNALTYYRLHDANTFQMTSSDPARLRRKQLALAALAQALRKQLQQYGIHPSVQRSIVEIIETGSDQLQLTLDGGWPWEMVRTEWRMYRALHPESRISHRLFKALALVASASLPPKLAHRLKATLARSAAYRRARVRYLPMPQMPHIQKRWGNTRTTDPATNLAGGRHSQ